MRPTEDEIRQRFKDSYAYHSITLREAVENMGRAILGRPPISGSADLWLEEQVAEIQATCYTCPGPAHPDDGQCPNLRTPETPL